MIAAKSPGERPGRRSRSNANTSATRSCAREADVFAFDLLRRTGRSPADFAAIMRRLADHHGDAGEGPVSYLSTHPPSEERIRAAESAN